MMKIFKRWGLVGGLPITDSVPLKGIMEHGFLALALSFLAMR
jgi:hypothetical protein